METKQELIDLIDQQSEKIVCLETQMRDIIKTEINKQTCNNLYNTNEIMDLALNVPNDYTHPINQTVEQIDLDWSSTIGYKLAEAYRDGWSRKKYTIAIKDINGNLLVKIHRGNRNSIVQFYTNDTNQIKNIICCIEEQYCDTFRNYLIVCSKYNSFMATNKTHAIRDHGRYLKTGITETINESLNQIKYDYYEYSTGPYTRHFNILCNYCKEKQINFVSNEVLVTISDQNCLVEITSMTNNELLLRLISTKKSATKKMAMAIDVMLDVYNSFNNCIRTVTTRLSVYVPVPSTSIVDYDIATTKYVSLCHINGDRYAKCQSNVEELVDSNVIKS